MRALVAWLDRLPALTRPARLAAFAAALAAPTLLLGFITDDLMMVMAAEEHLGRLTGPDAAALPTHVVADPILGLPNVFGFYNGDVESHLQLKAEGARPWWGAPELRLNLWRPLSSLLWIGDVAMFGRAALPHHLHSLVWNSALIFAAAICCVVASAPWGPWRRCSMCSTRAAG